MARQYMDPITKKLKPLSPDCGKCYEWKIVEGKQVCQEMRATASPLRGWVWQPFGQPEQVDSGR